MLIAHYSLVKLERKKKNQKELRKLELQKLHAHWYSLSFADKSNLCTTTLPLSACHALLLHSRCLPRQSQDHIPLTRWKSRCCAQTVRRNAHQRRCHVELHALRLLTKRSYPTFQNTLSLHAAAKRRFLELHHCRVRPKRRPR